MSEAKATSAPAPALSAKEQDHDESMTADQDLDSDQELETEDSDEGYDEDGAPGEWTKPKNMGSSVWYTDKKEMCRIVHPNGTFKDLPKEAFDLKTACAALEIPLNTKHPSLLPIGASAVASKRSRVMLFNEKATEPNPKAAGCVLRDVRGPVIFCEHAFASKTLNYITCSEALFCSISKSNPDAKVKPKTKKERKASTKSADAAVASIKADQKASIKSKATSIREVLGRFEEFHYQTDIVYPQHGKLRMANTLEPGFVERCDNAKMSPQEAVKEAKKIVDAASPKAVAEAEALLEKAVVDRIAASIKADQKAGVAEFKCLKGAIIVPWTQETTQAIVNEVARSKYHILVVRGLWDEEGEMGKYLLVSTKCPKESRRAVKDFGDVESLNLRQEEWFGRQGSNCWEDDIEGGTWTSEADISHDGGTKTLFQILSDLAEDDMISSIYTYPDIQSTAASHIKMLYERDNKAGRRARKFKMEPLVGASEDDGAADD